MKKAGIVGGLGPASTIDYYRGIIEGCRARAGDVYPRIIVDSVDMHKTVGLIERGDYAGVAAEMLDSISALRAAGAEFAAISANSPHIAWKLIEKSAPIPVVSIIDAACTHIKACGYKNVLIFATAFTMKNGLYTDALSSRGIGCTLPDPADIETVGGIIYPNLENGIVIPEDKKRMVAVAEKYIGAFGCDSLLLGCTEIPLMIHEGDVSVPVIDTTRIHIDSICDLVCG